MFLDFGLDRNRLAELSRAELTAFSKRTSKSTALRQRAQGHLPKGVPMSWMAGLYRFPPIYASEGAGPHFWDVDGNKYLDFNLCDLSMTCGFGNALVTESVTSAASKGAHFLLPTEESIKVAENLSDLTNVPFWQFTLSASSANAEVLRIARVITRRSKLVVFGGHYNGHFDEGLVEEDDRGTSSSSLLGLPPGAASNTIVVPFNDLDALEACLKGEDVALVLAEPVMTNCCVIVQPRAGYLQKLRELTEKYGTLLCYDEAHTFQFAYGGLIRHWGLACDFSVLGKGLGTGVSFGLYGMSRAVAQAFIRHFDVDIGPSGIATGGTTYATAIAVSTARVALEEILIPDAYSRIHNLGGALRTGLQAIIERHSLPWIVTGFGPRVSFCLGGELPTDGDEAWESMIPDFIDTRRIFMANRGIWDAVASAGPQVSFVHNEPDVEEYEYFFERFLQAAKGGAA